MRRLLAFGLCVAMAGAAEWPRFRGPNGAGVAEGKPLPAELGADKHPVWKTAIMKGKSSPVVTETRIFLTGHENGKLYTFALDRKTGKLLWTQESPGHRDEKRNALNDPAAPSPVSDGKNVYVFFAGFGLLSYTEDGVERWRKAMGPFSNFHGMGASPVYQNGKLFMIVDQDQNAYLVAVNAANGETLWKTERPEAVHSFSTPVLYKNQLIVPGSYQMQSYDTATGKEVWRVHGMTYQVKSVPVVDGDRLYFNGWAPGAEPAEKMVMPDFPEMIQKYDKDGDGKLAKSEVPKELMPGNWDMQDLDKDGLYGPKDWQCYQNRRTANNFTMGMKLDGKGDVTDSHVMWRYAKSLPDVPGVLLYKGVLYLVRNGGIVQSLDPETGAMQKTARLTGALDEYYASPVAGDGKVYMISRNGNVSVLAAGADWSISSSGTFDEEVFATPAIADGHMWVRTSAALYDFAGGK